MSLIESLWDWIYPDAKTPPPAYGRGIHALPNKDEAELFEQSIKSFKNRDIIDGYGYFLSSLIHHESNYPYSHLVLEQDDNELRFIIYQGLAKIEGVVRDDALSAYVNIAKNSSLHVALKRRFLERNFQLTYCRFSEKDDAIRLTLNLDNSTITPQKIFFPLRELALNADYEKEFIAGEFSEEMLLDFEHIQKLSSDRVKISHQMMIKWIQETRESLIGLLSNDNTGMISFSYLTLLLQIDYLLIPRKNMAKNISEKIGGYFSDDEKLTEDKNADLEYYIDELYQMDLEQFSEQFYRSAYTFSPFDNASHDEISAFVEESLSKVKWYKNNRLNYVISIIYRYISLYVLYNYGLHPTLRTLFHLHVEIYASDFFKTIGEDVLYDTESNEFNKELISLRIKQSIEPFTDRHKALRDFSQHLDYSDLDRFSHSFYMNIKNLDFTEN